MASLYADFDASQQIRLLINISFLDDHAQALISASLQVVDATEARDQYVALSYVWGRPEEQGAIMVDGQLLMVPTSLSDFIEMLRIEYQIDDLKFWADAVCIDQSNPVEKAMQVRGMKSIFENASQIFAWLGPQDDDARLALEMVQRILAHHDARQNALGSAELAFNNVDTRAPGFLDLEHGQPFDIEPYDALYRFVTNPWWSRAWIKQEASTGAATSLFCGQHYLTRLEMFIVAHYAKFIFEEINYQWKWNSSVERYEYRMMRRMLNRIFKLRIQPGYRRIAELDELPTSALTILEHVRNSECSDLRDKIYAGLGLIRPEQLARIEINYELLIEEVYINFAASMVNSTDFPNLDILGACIPRTDNRDELDLPSWVPDWSYWSHLSPFRKTFGTRDGPAYAADSTLPFIAMSNLLASPLVDGRRLRVTGMYVDRVLRMSKVSNIDEQFRLKLDWIPVSLKKERYFTGEATNDVWNKIVFGDVRVDPEDHSRYVRGASVDWDTVDNPNTKGWIAVITRLAETVNDRCLFCTAHGLLGIGPGALDVSDALYVLYGGQMVYALRKENETYQFIGECYIHGIMDGQAVRFVEEEIGRQAAIDKIIIK